MSTLFVLRNQQSLFLNRQGEWVSGREATSLFRAKHKDEALNEVFELSARDFTQRVQVESVPASEKGQPVIPEQWLVDAPEPETELAQASLEGLDAGESTSEQPQQSADLAAPEGDFSQAQPAQMQSA